MSRRGGKLAASFVITVAVLPACKKTSDPSEIETTSIQSRYDGTCSLSKPEHCPKGARCNPPPPQIIDCPPGQGDASAPRVTRRPPGKEDWVRVTPKLWAARGQCEVEGETFCAPPGKKPECLPQPPSMKVPCTALSDAGAGVGPHRVETFVWKDGVGGCHKVAAHDCAGDCPLPEGEPVACDAH